MGRSPPTQGWLGYERELYSIKEARELLGGISRNSTYELLRSGRLPSVVLAWRRFTAAAAIAELIAKLTTTVSPSLDYARSRMPTQKTLALRLPSVIGTKSRKLD